MQRISFFLFIGVVLFSSCKKQQYDYTPIVKVTDNDPFKKSMTGSQFFEIDMSNDQVIEGEKGVRIVIPKGSLLKKGDIKVTGKVKVELVEAFELSDMVFSNLTTTSNGEILETGGMFFINFTQDGEQLVVNHKIPVFIQIPKQNDKEMLLYKGIRDSVGNMNWTDPQKPVKYLTKVPLEELCFTPTAFDEAVVENLPINNVSVATRSFMDSLYYSIEKTYERMINYTPVYNPNELLEPNGERIKYDEGRIYQADTGLVTDLEPVEQATSNCGINPVSVKALKDKKFENTFISTKEFEIRIQTIHKTCRQDVLDIYVNHLDKNLTVVDGMAAKLLDGTKYQEKFLQFESEGLTNVKDAANSKYAQALAKFYTKKTKELENEIDKIQKRVQESLEKKDKEYVKALNEYQEILRKREKHRMEYYGYQLTENGWFNVDTGTVTKDWDETEIAMRVDNTEKFDMLNVYVYMPYNKSLLRLIPEGNNVFHSVTTSGVTIPMKKEDYFQVIAVGSIGERYFIFQKEDKPATESLISISGILIETDKSQIDKLLNKYSEQTKKYNDINVGWKYYSYFNEQQVHYDSYINEREKIIALYGIVCLCCDKSDNIIGKNLFNVNCSRCHYLDDRKFVGPGLTYVVNNKSFDFFRDFTTNNAKLRASGDVYANQIFEDYFGSLMPNFPLNENETRAIFDYIKGSKPCVVKDTLVTGPLAVQ